mmetsp:Transcript_29860/g.64625  ORF Transcript_29860/g.64625 Transcript_29860/m.64625 type:complete len:795 (+) Transcript_29860:90-2474(+)
MAEPETVDQELAVEVPSGSTSADTAGDSGAKTVPKHSLQEVSEAEAEEAVPKKSARVVYFDFDCTLAVFHVWKTLAGYEDHGPNSHLAKISGPFYMQEIGQLNRLLELGPEWSLRCFGGPGRLSAMRRLLGRINAEPGFSLAVMSKGCVGAVRKILTDLELLHFFDRVFAANYGSDGCDTISLPAKAQVLLGNEEDFILSTIDAKLATMHRDMEEMRGLQLQQAILVDDDPEEINMVMEYMEGVHVKSRGGFGHDEAFKLCQLLGLPVHLCLAPENVWQVPTAKEKQAGSRNVGPSTSSSRSPAPGRSMSCLGVGSGAAGLELPEAALKENVVNLCDLQEMICQEVECGKSLKKYAITAIAQRGRFGTTFWTKSRGSGGTKVMKKVCKSRLTDLTKTKNTKDSCILPILELFSDEKFAYVLTPSFHREGCDLLRGMAYVASHAGTIGGLWTAKVVRQVAEALRFVHETLGFPHGSIRPENILFGSMPENGQDVPHVLLGDCAASSNGPRQACSTRSTQFAAPELSSLEDNSMESDMWALGITVNLLLTGCHRRPLGTMRRISEGFKRLFECAEASSGRELVESLLQDDPSKRPRIAHVVRHPFLRAQRGPGRYFLSQEVCNLHRARDRARRVYPRLLRAVESRLASRLDSLRTSFEEADADKDNELNLKEFTSYWEKVDSIPKKVKPIAQEVFWALDPGNQGTISKAVFNTFAFSLRQLPKEELNRHLKTAFESLPSVAAHNGFLHVDGLKRLLEGEPELVVQTIFDDLDRDGEGLVSLESFSDMLLDVAGIEP